VIADLKKHALTLIVILLVGACAVGAVHLEGKKTLAHQQKVNGKPYGVLFQVDLDAIDAYILKQVKAGVEEYAVIRIEARYEDEWRVKEYDTGEFVKQLGLEAEFCCRKAKEVGTSETWKFCPYCRKGL